MTLSRGGIPPGPLCVCLRNPLRLGEDAPLGLALLTLLDPLPLPLPLLLPDPLALPNAEEVPVIVEETVEA